MRVHVCLLVFNKEKNVTALKHYYPSSKEKNKTTNVVSLLH